VGVACVRLRVPAWSACAQLSRYLGRLVVGGREGIHSLLHTCNWMYDQGCWFVFVTIGVHAEFTSSACGQGGHGEWGDQLLLYGIATALRVSFRIFRSDDAPDRLGLLEVPPLSKAVQEEVRARGTFIPIAYINQTGAPCFRTFSGC
jgi:hypothetical protein